MKITFTKVQEVVDEYIPKPANSVIPNWYKDISSYIDSKKQPKGDGTTSATIKRCMPVFDAITAGYILFTPVDVWVSQREGQPWYEWPSYGPIQFHPIEQAPNHPYRNGHNISYPKWINPWAIKTPKGYSTLFVQPFHRESTFTILPGIVDTDGYNVAVNFPFVLNDISFEGLIPAGTPMAQVIPFKRESWSMELGSKKELEEQNKISKLIKTKFFDAYKTLYRENKEYK